MIRRRSLEDRVSLIVYTLHTCKYQCCSCISLHYLNSHLTNSYSHIYPLKKQDAAAGRCFLTGFLARRGGRPVFLNYDAPKVLRVLPPASKPVKTSVGRVTDRVASDRDMGISDVDDRTKVAVRAGDAAAVPSAARRCTRVGRQDVEKSTTLWPCPPLAGPLSPHGSRPHFSSRPRRLDL